MFHWPLPEKDTFLTDISLKYALIPLANNRKITYKIYRTYIYIYIVYNSAYLHQVNIYT